MNVEHHEHGDALVTWTDDGVGMDAYIVRNYLAIAGKSYYHSKDFERLGLEMDPISRFGIGILSCFMVAEGIEIKTRYDPHLAAHGTKTLHIKIPSVEKQFRIEALAADSSSIGTSVNVLVEGKRLPKKKDSDEPQELDVTRYLCNIAGFVEFPIVVTEGKRKTVILHPDQCPAEATERFGDEFEVHQIDLEYPWDEVFFPQDLAAAHKVYRIERCDIRRDLGVGGYEGAICWPVVQDGFELRTRGMHEVTIDVDGDSPDRPHKVRHSDDWTSRTFDERRAGLSPSGERSAQESVFRDGVLVSKAKLPLLGEREGFMEDLAVPLPKVIVNLTKNRSASVDVARREVVNTAERWDKALWTRYLDRVVVPELTPLVNGPLTERLQGLLKLIAYRGIAPSVLWKLFPHDRWPIPSITKEGTVRIEEWATISSRTVFGIPGDLSEWCRRVLTSSFDVRQEGPFVLDGWTGDDFVIDRLGLAYGWFVWLDPMVSLWTTSSSESHVVRSVRFLVPPRENMTPELQEVWELVESDWGEMDGNSIRQRAAEDPAALAGLQSLMCYEISEVYRNIRCFLFPPPFEGCFGYGNRILNLRHPLNQAFLKGLAILRLAQRGRDTQKQTAREVRGILEDAICSILDRSWGGCAVIDEKWRGQLRQALATLDRYLGKREYEDTPIPTWEDFIPGTAAESADSAMKVPRISMHDWHNLRDFKASRPWGMVME